MEKNEKITVLSRIAFAIEHDDFILSRKETWLWNSDVLYRDVYKRKVTYGIRTIRFEEKTVVFAKFIFVCCPYELDAIDMLLLRFIHPYSRIIYMNEYPLLPAPKIIFNKRSINSVRDLILYIREAFHK